MSNVILYDLKNETEITSKVGLF